jgi:hypothetical protein
MNHFRVWQEVGLEVKKVQKPIQLPEIQFENG